MDLKFDELSIPDLELLEKKLVCALIEKRGNETKKQKQTEFENRKSKVEKENGDIIKFILDLKSFMKEIKGQKIELKVEPCTISWSWLPTFEYANFSVRPFFESLESYVRGNIIHHDEVRAKVTRPLVQQVIEVPQLKSLIDQYKEIEKKYSNLSAMDFAELIRFVFDNFQIA